VPKLDEAEEEVNEEQRKSLEFLKSYIDEIEGQDGNQFGHK
jgi:hypothetical protein